MVSSYQKSQAELEKSSSVVPLSSGDEDEDEVGVEEEEKDKPFDFFQWLFGWILDPIEAIIDGIIKTVLFIKNAILFFVNLPWCFKWYLFYMIGTILYLPLGLIFLFFGLQKVEKQLFKIRDQLDDLIVCNTGYSVIRYSFQIREGCFFETNLKRNCTTFKSPLDDMGGFIKSLFNDLTSFNFVTVVNSLAILLFIGLVLYYFLKPLFSKGSNSESTGTSADVGTGTGTGTALGVVLALGSNPALLYILSAAIFVILIVLWIIYSPQMLSNEMKKTNYKDLKKWDGDSWKLTSVT